MAGARRQPAPPRDSHLAASSARRWDGGGNGVSGSQLHCAPPPPSPPPGAVVSALYVCLRPAVCVCLRQVCSAAAGHRLGRRRPAVVRVWSAGPAAQRVSSINRRPGALQIIPGPAGSDGSSRRVMRGCADAEESRLCTRRAAWILLHCCRRRSSRGTRHKHVVGFSGPARTRTGEKRNSREDAWMMHLNIRRPTKTKHRAGLYRAATITCSDVAVRCGF